MAGVCSRHMDTCDPDCPACNTTIRELLPDYDKKHAEALAAGQHTCICGFTYYFTTNLCPLCCTYTKESRKQQRKLRKIDDNWEVSQS